MPAPRFRQSRTGHSLVELVAASVCSVILLAGLGSVMFIARQVADTPSASSARVEATEAINELANELRYATIITRYVDEVDEQSLEFVVADRDGDGRAERIRYDWPLHPDPDERVPSDPPQVFKQITVTNEDTDEAELVCFPIVSTVDSAETPNRPFRVELIESAPVQSPQQYTRARVELQTNLSEHSHVVAAVPLFARPERLAAYWRTDFDPGINPTTIDIAGDGAEDWAASNGATFAAAVLNNGTWTSNGYLTTTPSNNFTTTTVVESCFKNMAASGVVPVLQINVDRHPILVRLQRQYDGTQTLTVLKKPASGAEELLKEITNLKDDYVRLRMSVNPATRQVSLQVNDIGDDVLGGPYTYTNANQTSSDRFLRLFSGPRFDYIEVRSAAN